MTITTLKESDSGLKRTAFEDQVDDELGTPKKE